MIMISALPPMKLVPLQRISPSRFAALELCALKEIWSASRQTTFIPSSPAARLGTAAHKVLELVNKGKASDEQAIREAWDAAVKEVEKGMEANQLERHLVPLKESSYNYEVKRRMTLAFACSLQKTQRVSSPGTRASTAGPEVWVESPDRTVGGYIDFIHEQNGAVELIDYKSGAIKNAEGESPSLKHEYGIQMKLYAALYHAAHGRWPKRITVVGLDNSSCSEEVNTDECSRLFQDAKKRREDINMLIGTDAKAEDLAQPSSAACYYCPFRPACIKYWQERQTSDEWPADEQGDLVSIKTLGNGLIKMSIASSVSPITVRSLSPERHTIFKEGVKKVMFCNLVKDTAPGYFVEGPLTVCYKLEND